MCAEIIAKKIASEFIFYSPFALFLETLSNTKCSGSSTKINAEI